MSEPYADQIGNLYISTTTTIHLESHDPSDAYAEKSGVAMTRFLVHSASVTPVFEQLDTYQFSFQSPSEGQQVISYASQDAAGNQEVVRSTTVFADGTPPVTTSHFSEQCESDARGNISCGLSVIVSLTAIDPISGGAASGILRIAVSTDDISASLYTEPFSLSEGYHPLVFGSVDNVGNAESPHLLNVFVGVEIDTFSPITQAIIIGTSTNISGDFVATFGSSISFIATDFPNDISASGVSEIYGLLDISPEYCPGGAPVNWPDLSFPAGSCQNALFGGPALLPPGQHTLYFYSIDRAGNQEPTQSLQINVIEDAGTLPGPITVTGRSEIGINITWDLNGSPLGTAYNIRIGTAPAGASCDLSQISVGPEIPVSADWAQLTGLLPSTNYTIQVCNPLLALTSTTTCNTAIVAATSRGGFESTPPYFMCGGPGIGNLAAAVDPSGNLWQISNYSSALTLKRQSTDGNPELSLPLAGLSVTAGWNLTFDGSGNVYVLANSSYTAKIFSFTSQGAPLTATEYPPMGGYRKAMTKAGDNLWIVGRSTGMGALWQAGPSGLNLVKLFPGATSQDVMGGGGMVWVAGAKAEAALWRYNPSDGTTTRFDWANTLGGAGSSAQALSKDGSGNIWLGGWARNTTGVVAALWRFDGSALSLVATSTGAYADQAQDLALDAVGRVWLTGSAQTDPSGSTSLTIWQYPGNGSTLNQLNSYPDYLPAAPTNQGNRLTIFGTDVYTLGLDQNGDFKVLSQSLGQGDISGSLSYAAAFSGGRVFFIVGAAPDLDDSEMVGPLPAPASGTLFEYTLTGLPAPATYYFAAIYDASGTMDPEPPLGSAPIGIYLSPTFVLPSGTAFVPQVVLSPDQQAPSVVILKPVSGSTETASLVAISGTAADNIGAGKIVVGIQNLTENAWWVPASAAFTSTTPVWSDAERSGPMNIVSWSLSAPGLGAAIEAGKDYGFYAQASDPSGNVGFATTTISMTATVSGTVSYSGLLAGTTVTVVVSMDNFMSEPAFHSFVAPADAVLPYSVSVAPPASIQLGALVGDPEQISPATPIGFYDHLATIPVALGASISGIDFSIGLDTTPPMGAITTPVDGSTISALGIIEGTAQDDVAIEGRVDLAVHDLGTGLWWDGENRRWLAGSEPVYVRMGKGGLQETASWSVDASSTSSGGENYGSLAGYLRTGGKYTLYARAVDLVGNTAVEPAAVTFRWSGPTGSVAPPPPAWVSGVALSTLAIQFNWALVDGATGYTVYRSTSGPKVTSVTSNYIIQGTTVPNTARTRCVASANEYGEGPMKCSQAVYSMAAVPGEPQAVSVSSDSITWAWDASGNPVGTYYALAFSTDTFTTHFSTPILFSMLYQSTSATLSNLAPDTPYSVRVWAANMDMVRTTSSPIASTRTLAGLPSLVMNPVTGPIGMPFTITGSGFGTYDGANTRVRFGEGGPLAPLSLWNDTTITGTVPGLAPGSYAVAIERQAGSTLTVVSAGSFEVLVPQISTYTPLSGPIGTPFTLTGSAFGPYAGSRTRVLIGGIAVPLSLWNDTTITGTVPGAVLPGIQPLVAERTTADGGLVQTTTVYITITTPEVAGMSSSTGPIGLPFTITGTSFGPYNGSNTRVKIGGIAAPLSLWNDTTITGTIPGLAAGLQPVVVERSASDGGLVASATVYFEVTVPSITLVVPTSGPIGITLTVTGTSFGPYAGSLTRLLIGGATAPLSVWNDTQIIGTVPGLAPEGQVSVIVERATSGGGLVRSNTAYFEVTALQTAAISPSAGPIGIPFTITGTSFGAYNGSNTRVRFGEDGPLAPLSVWNDTTITGTVPGLIPGDYAVLVERQQGETVALSTAGVFTVSLPQVSTFMPVSGPIGVPFTITGTSFGPYNGSTTRVKIGGTAAPLSLWTDTQIQGTIPGILPGSQSVIVERTTSDGGLAQSGTFYFEVTVPSVAVISPLSGPIGTAFTLTGTSFGPYNGASTVVKIGGYTASLSVWNDTAITGTIPGAVPTGEQPVVVERITSDGGLIQSATVYFSVTGPLMGTLNPSTGPIGIPFTITGTNFGAYNGANTRIKFGEVIAPLSVWSDTSITGTVPGLSSGTYEVVVERQEGAAVSRSMAASFTATLPQVSGMTPVSGPIGTPFTITGTSFGPYNGSNTRVKIGGVAASLSLWNDTTITGTIPSLEPGSHAAVLERVTADGGLMQSDTGYFEVVLPAIATLTPSSAPIGAPFTITGTGFGPYAGSLTKVLIAGVAAPLSLWNDTTITGRVPGAVAGGQTTLTVQRTTSSGGLAEATTDFLVIMPQITQLAPTSGQPGDAFEIQGTGFGPYNGSTTKVTFSGTAAPLSLWTNTVIRGLVPAGLSVGTYTVVAVLSPSGGTVESNAAVYGVGTEGMGVLGMSAELQAPRPEWYYEASLALPSEEGGKVTAPSHAAVEVPPLALETTTTLTIDRGAVEGHESESRTRVLAAVAMAAAGEPVKFGPEGTRFSVPVTIELPYDPAAILLGHDNKVAVHYWDPGTKTWTPLPSEVDSVRRVVRAKTNHFSLYQPLLPGDYAVAAAAESFSHIDHYAFPNPSRGGQAVTIRVQAGRADSVDVNVYDLAGRKVHSGSASASTILDDGNGKGAQYTFDVLWDASGAGSGVYFYVITAKKAGFSSISKRGKVGVIR
jgi:hypothetical protein